MVGTATQFMDLLEKAKADEGLFARIRDVLGAIAGEVERIRGIGSAVNLLQLDAKYFNYLRSKFGPAVNAFERVAKGGSNDPRFRSARGALGGASHWMYAHQEPTFKGAVRLLLGFVPFSSHFPQMEWYVHMAWLKYKEVEIHYLAQGRR